MAMTTLPRTAQDLIAEVETRDRFFAIEWAQDAAEVLETTSHGRFIAKELRDWLGNDVKELGEDLIQRAVAALKAAA